MAAVHRHRSGVLRAVAVGLDHVGAAAVSRAASVIAIRPTIASVISVVRPRSRRRRRRRPGRPSGSPSSSAPATAPRSPPRRPRGRATSGASIAAERIVPIGFARSAAGDVRRRAVDRLVQAERAVLGPALAERGRRQHPEAAGEHRRLVGQDVAEQVLGDDHVERTPGCLTSSIAHESTSWWLTSTSGKPGRSSSTTVPPEARRGEDVGLVDARQAARGGPGRARSRARRRAGSRPRCTAACRAAARSPTGPVASLALAEVDAAGQLADDQQVDAGQQLRPERRRRDERRDGPSPAGGWRTAPARRAARTAPAPAGRSRSGRPTSARRPRRAGSRRPRRPASTSSGRIATPYASIASPPASDVRPVDVEAERLARRVEHAPRGAATTSGPTPSPGIAAIR